MARRSPIRSALAYLSKYEEGIKSIGLTPEILMGAYRLVRVTPVKFRTVAAVG